MRNKPDGLFLTRQFATKPQTAFIAAEKTHTRFFGAVSSQNRATAWEDSVRNKPDGLFLTRQFATKPQTAFIAAEKTAYAVFRRGVFAKLRFGIGG